jgi:diphthamide biosynthesis protein 4
MGFSSSSQDERTEADYYKTLQVSSNASPSELRTSYLRLIKLHHPDKLKQPSHPSPVPQPSHSDQLTEHNRFAQDLIHAYSTLIDPVRRTEYDLKRLQSSPGHEPVCAFRATQSIEKRVINLVKLIILYECKASSTTQTKIVSQVLDLSEFTQLEHEGHQQPDGERFVFSCRCGGQFLISEDQMNAGIEIIGCDGCSLTVKVEYQCL